MCLKSFLINGKLYSIVQSNHYVITVLSSLIHEMFQVISDIIALWYLMLNTFIITINFTTMKGISILH